MYAQGALSADREGRGSQARFGSVGTRGDGKLLDRNRQGRSFSLTKARRAESQHAGLAPGGRSESAAECPAKAKPTTLWPHERLRLIPNTKEARSWIHQTT